MIWMRPSGNTIELKDTPNMEKFATDKGWAKTKPEKKEKKKQVKKAD